LINIYRIQPGIAGELQFRLELALTMKFLEVFWVILAFCVLQGCNFDGPRKPYGLGQETAGKGRLANPGSRDDSYVEGELIVRFGDDTGRQQAEKVVSSINGKLAEEVSRTRNTYLVKIPANLSVQAAIAELSRRKEVLYAEPNRIYRQLENK
jgi:hypothetical protein